MTRPSRSKVFFFGAALSSGSAALAFACGDDGSSPSPCQGAACDGGTESSVQDGPGGDTNVTDGGGDSDSSLPIECDGSGAGTLDPSFGDGGLVWLYYSNGQAMSVAVQPDGKILVGGATAGQNLALVRLQPNGSLDSTFGDAGLVETKIGTLNPGFDSLALQPDGKIVAVSRTTSASGTDFGVVRFLSSGALDSTFGDAGVVVTDFGNTSDQPAGVVLFADGRILVGGQSAPTGPNPNTDFALALYKQDGSLDSSFGTGGKVTIDVRGTVERGGSIAQASAGRIIIAGQSANDPPGSVTPAEISAVGLTSNGSLDLSFADAGKLVTNFGGSGSQRANAVLVDGSGRVVLAGRYEADFGVVRLTPAGVLDGTFGDAGVAATDFGGRYDVAGTVLLQQDGKMVVAGISDLAAASTTNIAIARYLPSGQLDPSFGTNGETLIAPPPNADVGANAAAFSACSLLVVGTWGYANNSIPQNAMGVARFRR